MKTLYIPVTYGPYPYSAGEKPFKLRPQLSENIKDMESGPYFHTEREAIEWAKQRANELNRLQESKN